MSGFLSMAPIAAERSDTVVTDDWTDDWVDIVILANGPGEVATWVKPVVRSLQSKTATHAANYRISVILSPCPHASGQEPLILSGYPEVSRVQSAPHFFRFLLTGKTADNWDWHPKGVVVFLGGDQLYTVLVAKRLGYRTVTYAEWDARWTGLIDRFAVMQPGLAEKAPAAYRHKFTVVGDLMADVQAIADRTAITTALGCAPDAELIGFLPGSKPAKLEMGVPMCLAIAAHIHTERSHTQYVVGVAPNLSLADLTAYADPDSNSAIALLNAPAVTLHQPSGQSSGQPSGQSSGQPSGLPYWQIENGPKIYLWQRFPALDLFSQCQLCVTTVGANTAQLGALAIPMIVLLPPKGSARCSLQMDCQGWFLGCRV